MRLPICASLLIAILSVSSCVPAQSKGSAASAASTAAPNPSSPEALTLAAWFILTDSAEPARHAELRIQALAALALLGTNPRSVAIIESSMADKDVDIRTAAILAAKETRSAIFIPALRKAMNTDPEPQVSFTAATALWKLNDRSGQDLLTAIAKGERGTSSTMVNGAKHKLSKTLHDPAGLAKTGATQGASMLLGPFGMGVSAFEYLHKSGSNAARVAALELIAEDRSAGVRQELIEALKDKDDGVRAAAAKALGTYHDAAAAEALSTLFPDSKLPVRLTAAASYLLSTGAAAPPPPPRPVVNAPQKPLPSTRKK